MSNDPFKYWKRKNENECLKTTYHCFSMKNTAVINITLLSTTRHGNVLLILTASDINGNKGNKWTTFK